MKHSAVLALAISCVVVAPLHAQEATRYDKSIEEAAIKRAAEKIGTLRGIIQADSNRNFVTKDDMVVDVTQPETITLPTPLTPYRKAWQSVPGTKKLPPMVMGEMIDPVVTGEPFKFNHMGEPMEHHQVYPRPTPLSSAASLIEAMDLNPYPGDE